MGLIDALYRALTSVAGAQTCETTVRRYARDRGIATTGDGLRIERHGVVVTVTIHERRRALHVRAELRAHVAAPTDARLDRTPNLLPIDDEDVAALWKEIRTALPAVALNSDGRVVRMRTQQEIHAEWLLDAMIEVVARMTRWDDGLLAALLSLPDAHAIDGHRLAPAVQLAADQLVVGVDDGRRLVAEVHATELAPTTATLAGGAALVVEPTRATLTWRRVERDPAALADGVAALRAAVRSGRPYR